MELGRPSAEDWYNRYKVVEKYQRAWRAECSVLEQMYELRWRLTGVPANVPVTIPSTARAIIDEATDHSDFDPHYLRIHTPSYGLEQAAEEKAGRIRSWSVGWAAYQIERLNDVSPYREWIKNQYLFGKGVYKVVFSRDDWPEISIPEGSTNDDARRFREMTQEQRRYAMPIVLRAPDPRAIYEDVSIGDKRYVIEAYEYTGAEIEGLYPYWRPSSIDPNDLEALANMTVQVWDCWQIGEQDGEKGSWHSVLIAESPVTEDDGVMAINISYADGPGGAAEFIPGHPFPYVVKFSGFGRQSPGRYEEKARGILYGAKSLLEAEARRLTQLDSIIASYAWPTVFVTGPRSRFEVVYGPNQTNYVPPGTQVSTVTPTIPAGPIQAALATIQSGIERATFGSVIRGDKPPQTTSAAQLAILSGQARLRFGSIKLVQEAALREVFTKALGIAKDVVASPLSVFQWDDTDSKTPSELVLKPADIPYPISMYIEVLSDPAEEQERRIQLASFLHERGVIDDEEFRERAGIKDTAAMRRRTIRDLVLKNSPGIIQALGEEFLLESGYDIESLTLEKMARDILIARRREDLQRQLLGGGQGGENNLGNLPAPGQIAPNPLGGSPGNGVQVPTPATAGQAGMQTVSG